MALSCRPCRFFWYRLFSSIGRLKKKERGKKFPRSQDFVVRFFRLRLRLLHRLLGRGFCRRFRRCFCGRFLGLGFAATDQTQGIGRVERELAD